MSMSPWDLTGNVGFDFDQYRPRRPSYVFATQELTAAPGSSYQNATDQSDFSVDLDAPQEYILHTARSCEDFSHRAPSTRNTVGSCSVASLQLREGVELRTIHADNLIELANHVGASLYKDNLRRSCSYSVPNHNQKHLNNTRRRDSDTSAESNERDGNGTHENSLKYTHTTPIAENRGVCKTNENLAYSRWRYIKNLVVLSLSFILVFSAFRSIQNLQSSLNKTHRLGVVAMCLVHISMFMTCLLVPALIDRISSKWTMVLGLLFYLLWISANFFPHPYTLLPTSVGVGFGQSLAWGAQVRYIQQLALDSAHVSKELTHQELYKFNGIFLACFQTSHIWGNLVSSLILGSNKPTSKSAMEAAEVDTGLVAGLCGVYDVCGKESALNLFFPNSTVLPASNTVMKLMGSYLVFAFTGFILIVLFLERLTTRSQQPASSNTDSNLSIWLNLRHLYRSKAYRLLIPLLVFNGFEQGFVYSDYTKAYLHCTLGQEFIGYNMITLGLANSLFSVLVGLLAKHVAREAIIGIASILHLGLFVFLLVWAPDKNLLPVFFVISALWGICDAIWQTQCNCLVNLCCINEHDVAFQNFRMLQGFGAASAFLLSTVLCVTVKLYILIALLLLSVVCYIFTEYLLRKPTSTTAVLVSQTNRAISMFAVDQPAPGKGLLIKRKTL